MTDINVFLFTGDPICRAGLGAQLDGVRGIQVVDDCDIDRAQVAVVFADSVEDDLVKIVRAVQRSGTPRVVLVVGTIDEAGVKGYDMSYWFAAYAPAGTPPAVVTRLRELLVNATKSAPVKGFYENAGVDAWTTSSDELAKFQASETQKWGKVIKAAGIEPE